MDGKSGFPVIVIPQDWPVLSFRRQATVCDVRVARRRAFASLPAAIVRNCLDFRRYRARVPHCQLLLGRMEFETQKKVLYLNTLLQTRSPLKMTDYSACSIPCVYC